MVATLSETEVWGYWIIQSAGSWISIWYADERLWKWVRTATFNLPSGLRILLKVLSESSPLVWSCVWPKRVLKSEIQKDRAQLSITEPLACSLFTRQDGFLDAWCNQPCRTCCQEHLTLSHWRASPSLAGAVTWCSVRLSDKAWYGKTAQVKHQHREL